MQSDLDFCFSQLQRRCAPLLQAYRVALAQSAVAQAAMKHHAKAGRQTVMEKEARTAALMQSEATAEANRSEIIASLGRLLAHTNAPARKRRSSLEVEQAYLAQWQALPAHVQKHARAVAESGKDARQA